MKQAKYFYDSISPTVIASMLLGLNPIFIKNYGNERLLYTNRFLYSINVGCVTVFTVLVIKTISDAKNSVMSNKYYDQNKVSNIGIAFVFMGGIIYVIIIYIYGFLKTQSIKTTLERIYKIDQILEKFGQNLKYRKAIMYQLVTLFSAYFLICFNTTMQYQNIRKEKFRSFSTTTWIVFVAPAFIVNTFESQFAHTVLLIYERFKMLNEQVRNLRYQTSNKYYDAKIASIPRTFGTKDNELKLSIMSEKIRILMQMHDELCDIAKVVNRNYTLPAIVVLIFQYGTLLFSLFYTYWMFNTKPLSATCWLLWSTLKASEVLHVTISCHLAAREARATGAAVHKLLIAPCGIEIQKNLMAFSNQLMHRRVRFTIWGILILDATLLFTSIGAAATYMVIMLQFQQASLPMTCKANIVANASTIAPIN